MLEVKGEEDFIPILLRNVVLAILKCETEMKKLAEDLTQMGYEGIFPKLWNMQNEAMMWEVMFGRRN